MSGVEGADLDPIDAEIAAALAVLDGELVPAARIAEAILGKHPGAVDAPSLITRIARAASAAGRPVEVATPPLILPAVTSASPGSGACVLAHPSRPPDVNCFRKRKDDSRMPTDSALSRYAPYALAALRIMSALLCLEHGTQKYFAFPPSDYFPEAPALFSLMGIAGVLELVGGVLLLIGLFTRPVAFVMSGFMAAAYFIGHAPQGFFPADNMGEAAILFCFVFLYLVFAGPGAWSADAARGKAPA